MLKGIFGTEFQITDAESDITATSTWDLSSAASWNFQYSGCRSQPGLVVTNGIEVMPPNQIAVVYCSGYRMKWQVINSVITGHLMACRPEVSTKPLNSEAVTEIWATLEPDVENRSDTYPNSTRETAPTTIVEANGWAIAFQRTGNLTFCIHYYTQ